MLQGLALANSHVFTEFVDSEKSPMGLFFIDAVVMWALEPLGMTMHVYIYIYTYGYTSIAFQSAIRHISINYFLQAYVAHILASKKSSNDHMAY